MALTTSLKGRVRNTSLPKSHSLLPLIEAIVNSLQALDARFGNDVERGRIRVQIERSAQEVLDLPGPGRAPLSPIVGFTVQDNGVGFTPDNMRSFETLDSDYKAAVGCRGVGRLLWLKAFDRVAVRSAYKDDRGDLQTLQFRFSVDREVESGDAPEDFDDTGTIVNLDGFKAGYQKNAPKTVDAIAREVFEHCIWYFLRPGGAPDVAIVDSEAVSLNALMEEFVYSSLPTTTVNVKGENFDMMNLCLNSSSRNITPRLYWCAANRVVVEENLSGTIPGLYGRLKDSEGNEFTYVCYLSSNYLDANVRSDRTGFGVDERISDPTLGDDITLEDIRAVVLKEVEVLLDGPLSVAREEGKERVSNFVSNHAPRYRPVLARLDALGETVDPSMKDADLEVLLHRNLRKLEDATIAEGHAMFSEDGCIPPEDYHERLTAYVDVISDINMSDLAAYVSRRRVILDLLAKLIKSDDAGKYTREDNIHSLLMPMRKDSNEIGTDASNLWIVDERLAFHDYLGSDKTLKSMPITGSESTKEPDIVSTRLVDTPVLAAEGETVPLPSIVVIEIKRPMRNDAREDKDPIAQTLEYVKKIRNGGMLTASGRPLPTSDSAPAFCYVIADLTPTMIGRCEHANLKRTYDGLAYFGYNDAAKAYVEVISFDGLLKAAMERNRAFFDKLGLPSGR